MSTTTSTSAAQKVFGIAELVAMIVEFVYEDLQATVPKSGKRDIFDRAMRMDTPVLRLEQRRAALVPLASINRLWFQSIVPVLWRHPTQARTDPCLTALFWNIDPDRRGIYAQYIENGTLVFTGSRVRSRAEKIRRTTYGETEDQVLAAVDFPRLKVLYVKARLGYRLPQLGHHCVEYILFDAKGRHNTYNQFCKDLLQFEVGGKRAGCSSDHTP